MPRLDGTGPMGMGPMTGRSFEYCSGHGAFRPFGRRGLGYRRGFDRRPYNYYGAPQVYRIDSEEEQDILLRQKEFLEEELEAIKRELEKF